jgi:hypothetical protein
MRSKSARTRERILYAAAHVLSRKGYAGTRPSDVADQAEIQTPAIYYYFASRDDLRPGLTTSPRPRSERSVVPLSGATCELIVVPLSGATCELIQARNLRIGVAFAKMSQLADIIELESETGSSAGEWRASNLHRQPSARDHPGGR